jgi:hypothetical protein
MSPGILILHLDAMVAHGHVSVGLYDKARVGFPAPFTSLRVPTVSSDAAWMFGNGALGLPCRVRMEIQRLRSQPGLKPVQLVWSSFTMIVNSQSTSSAAQKLVTAVDVGRAVENAVLEPAFGNAVQPDVLAASRARIAYRAFNGVGANACSIKQSELLQLAGLEK